MNLKELALRLDTDLAINRRANITDENALDTQALCVAEEAGELVGAYRRWAGRARRLGTKYDLALEIADVLIVTAVFAKRAGIDIDEAVTDKLEIIYGRGWRTDDGS
jgi:NTP pyrophosphatase (non-canonical NTP hydrolase)